MGQRSITHKLIATLDELLDELVLAPLDEELPPVALLDDPELELSEDEDEDLAMHASGSKKQSYPEFEHPAEHVPPSQEHETLLDEDLEDDEEPEFFDEELELFFCVGVGSAILTISLV